MIKKRVFIYMASVAMAVMPFFAFAQIPYTQSTLGTPVFYSVDKRTPIKFVTCGETYVFDVEGYDKSEVFLFQNKSNRPVFEGTFSIPMEPYTSVCGRDEGKYITYVYEARTADNGNRYPGVFIGKVDFEIKSAIVAQKTEIRLIAPGIFSFRPASDHDSVRSGYFYAEAARDELLKQYNEEMNILVYIPTDSLIDFASSNGQGFCTCAWGAQVPADGIGYPWVRTRFGALQSYALIPTANWWKTGFGDDKWTMYALLHELGHAWSTFFGRAQGELNKFGLLEEGQFAHWGYLSDNHDSLMAYGPARLLENSSSFFTPVWKSVEELSFNDFDLYAMGVLPANMVKPMFVVTSPLGLSKGPKVETFRGFKREISINDIINFHGQRSPLSGTSRANPTNNVKVTFLIVQAPDGTNGELEVIGEKVKQIANILPQTWQEKTRGLSSLIVYSPSARIAPPLKGISAVLTVSALRRGAEEIFDDLHDDTGSLLRSIEEQKADFEKAINVLSGNVNAVITTAASSVATVSVTRVPGGFTHFLSSGSRGEDVRRLQEFLNSDPDTRIAFSGVGSPGNETDFYGQLTVLAVQKFQRKYGIISSGSPEISGYGAVGPRTQTKLNELLLSLAPAQPIQQETRPQAAEVQTIDSRAPASEQTSTPIPLPTGSPGFYKGPFKVSSITCGDTYRFQVDGYSASQIWLFQLKNGAKQYDDKIDIPLTYTSKCNQDEGTYISQAYTVSSTGDKGMLLGNANFTINPQVTYVQPVLIQSSPTCTFSFSKTDINVGDTVSWTGDSNPSGLNAYWYGTKNNSIDVGGAFAGVTKFTESFQYLSEHLGTYTRYLEMRDSTGNTVCTTNKNYTITVSAKTSSGTVPSTSASALGGWLEYYWGIKFD